jgi:quercetin dioxygenase-like cupin family protein
MGSASADQPSPRAEETTVSDGRASAGEVQSWDSNTMPWQLRHIEELDAEIAVKPLVEDPDTGMSAMKLKYFAGFTNSWHTHNCAHGMYVLDGVLKTHVGSFGPGSFVWFPEGMTMEHGATQDNDVTVLFITNKPLDIHYVSALEAGAESE